MNILREISYLLGLAANCTIIIMLFHGIFRSKSGPVILGISFVVMAAARWLLIGLLGVPSYYASLFCIVVPCAVLCFFLSKYHDGRFFFTYFLSLNIYLIIRVLASIASTLPSSPVTGIWVEMIIKLSLLFGLTIMIRMNSVFFREALLEDASWNTLGIESVLSTVLLLKMIADLDKFKNRAEFYPELLLYCIILLSAYIVIIRVIKRQRDKKQLISDALKASEEAGLAKTSFLSRMSHEIRTPLNAIIGLAELGKNNLSSPQPNRDEGMDYVTKTLDSSRYLLALINDILDMSKMENSEIKLVS